MGGGGYLSPRGLSARSRSYRVVGVHMLVFVHGFQGNSLDMRLMKNIVAQLYPNGLYLCSCSNELETDGDIRKMGKRLADEVRQFVQEEFSCQPDMCLGRLSFITHS